MSAGASRLQLPCRTLHLVSTFPGFACPPALLRSAAVAAPPPTHPSLRVEAASPKSASWSLLRAAAASRSMLALAGVWQ